MHTIMTVHTKKTFSFAVLHFTVAFIVSWAVTGSLMVASLLALLEPMANTVAYFFHDKAWTRVKTKSVVLSSTGKTISFAILHMGVAFTLSWLLTGDLAIASIMALLEPAINTGAYFFHEIYWSLKLRKQNTPMAIA